MTPEILKLIIAFYVLIVFLIVLTLNIIITIKSKPINKLKKRIIQIEDEYWNICFKDENENENENNEKYEQMLLNNNEYLQLNSQLDKLLKQDKITKLKTISFNIFLASFIVLLVLLQTYNILESTTK